ncbi:hypothetical protein FRB91_003274 [Serendipita sp. 411]|nr:hypothetical protein FRB91_003274 [Serendipita sp. 411]
MKSTQKSEPTQYSALNDDVLYHLCLLMRTDNFQGLIKLSMVDRRTRVVSTPLMFEQIESFLAWDRAQEKFEVILENRTILSSVRVLSLNFWDDAKPEHSVPSAIFTLLASLTHLVEFSITVGILTKHGPLFQSNIDEYLSGSLSHPSLRSLHIGNRELMFLVESISPLESLVIEELPFQLYIEKLGDLHPGLRKLHCSGGCDTTNVRRIARCLPNLRDIGFLSIGYLRYWAGSILGHLASFRVFPMLESITLSDILDLGIDGCIPSQWEVPLSEDELIVRKERAIERLLEGIENDIMTEDGPKLQTVVIGHILCKVDANGRLRRVKRI